MKKLVSILLALAMILAMSIPAFAAENTSLTISNSDGRTYDGYRLLDVTTSLKTGEHHPATCDGNHTDGCYNYAYTIENANYRHILREETLANGRNALWGDAGKPATAAGVTDAQILEYLSGQTSGIETGTMRQVADRLYRAIIEWNSKPENADNKIQPDVTGLTGTQNVQQGYWMFADVTPLNGNEANSLVMVDTAGQQAITITPKTALPTIEKKVKDIEDTEDSKIGDNEWHDTADHDINDEIPFKVTATLPSNAQSYQSYQIIFHDTMSDSLTLNEATIQILMYETKHRADADVDLNDGVDVTDKFVVETDNLDDANCTFEVSCENVFTIEGVTKDTAFVVYYTATLNENAEIGATGNPNEVYLEFSNNPYDNTKTGKTEIDEVTVYTYQLVINKIDDHKHPLEGAEFTLYKKVLGVTDPVEVAIDASNVANPTTFTWTGLDDGDYILKETKAPAGYNEMAPVEFTITATHTQTEDGELKLLTLDGGKMGIGDTATGIIDEDVVNHTGTVLPETGAEGTFFLITGGTLLVLMAVVFMITRKKMSIYED